MCLRLLYPKYESIVCDDISSFICNFLSLLGSKLQCIFSYVAMQFIFTIHLPHKETDVDFETKLAKLMSGMGCALVTSWNKYVVIMM